jgi:hypothetical protein
MDPIKDSQKTEGIIKFFDSQTLQSSPFGENRVADRAYRRAERLASALILLTSHVPPSDSLKTESINTSIQILSVLLSMRDDMRSVNSNNMSVLRTCVRKEISLMRLMAISGYVSLQNAEILISAFDELMTFINSSKRSSMSDKVSYSRDELSDIRDVHKNVSEPFHTALRPLVHHDTKAPSTDDVTATNSPSRVSSRGRAILEVLRLNGELGIRDIAANLPEYSEKMIQRELVELTSSNRVKKSGAKRWSKYLIVEVDLRG